jgi:thioredoxin reductase
MHDVIVVGGSFAGLSAAIMLARCLRDILVFDTGMPRNAAARELHGFLGHDRQPPHVLLARGREELQHYGVGVIHDEVVAVECLAPESAGRTAFEVRTRGGLHHRCRKILFATGVHDELPAIPGLRDCYGVSVHHCPYCDGWEHRDQQLVAFGSDSHKGAGLALALRTWSASVTLLTHGGAVGATDERRLRERGIAWRLEPIDELQHAAGRLNRVIFTGGASIQADALFFAANAQAQCALPVELGCRASRTNQVDAGRRQHTDVPGVFVAGDADGEVQLAIVAASEGATAALAINRELQDEGP